MTTTGIIARHDWLNVVAPLGVREQLQALVEEFIGAGVRRDRGANTYAESIGWESGCMLAWTEGRPECWLSMNGDSCDLIMPELKVEFFARLVQLGCRATRVDVAVDCPRAMLSMEVVHAAAAAGSVDGFKRYQPLRPVANMNTGELEGDQASFGRRGRDGSGRYVRIYDKGLESGGSIDAVRVETEYAADLADVVFVQLASSSSVQQLESLCARFAVSSIDFVDKSGAHRHRARFVRLGWWERLLSAIGTARVKVERVKPALERSVEYVRRAAPLILARLERVVESAGMGGVEAVHAFVDQLLVRGRRRLRVLGDHVFPRDVCCDVGELLLSSRLNVSS